MYRVSFFLDNKKHKYIYSMNLLIDSKPPCLSLQNCQCSACTYIPRHQIIVEQSDLGRPNQFHDFVKMLPSGFPIVIEQTVVLSRNQGSTDFVSFYNIAKDDKCKWMLSKQQVRSLNILLSQNVQLYFPTHQKIIPKYQALSMFTTFSSSRSDKSASEIIYIQPYQSRPVVRTSFHHERPLQDILLVEYLSKEEDNFRNNNYKMNEQMLEWVYREYGEESFCTFLTQYYSRLFKALTGHQVKSGIFFWALQPYENNYSSKSKTAEYDQLRLMGRPRKLPFKPKLLNIKAMQVDLFQKLYSFQEEYSDIIKQKINSSQKTAISAIKNKAYRLRLDNFRTKLKNVYENEQSTILEKIQEEKQFEFQHDTETMARMLIPNLAPYKSLREVIGNQQAFRKVFAKEVKGEWGRHRFKTEYNVKSEPIKKKILSPIKGKERSKTMLKEDLGSFYGGTVERRYKKLMKTPSTHD